MSNDASTVSYWPDRDPFPEDRTDWARLRTMTDEEVEAAALDDPDNLPLGEAELSTSHLGSGVRHLRERLGLTLPAFAAAYRLPPDLVRDWEAGLAIPDAPARALLDAIAQEPDTMRRLLASAA